MPSCAISRDAVFVPSQVRYDWHPIPCLRRYENGIPSGIRFRTSSSSVRLDPPGPVPPNRNEGTTGSLGTLNITQPGPSNRWFLRGYDWILRARVSTRPFVPLRSNPRSSPSRPVSGPAWTEVVSGDIKIQDRWGTEASVRLGSAWECGEKRMNEVDTWGLR